MKKIAALLLAFGLYTGVAMAQDAKTAAPGGKDRTPTERAIKMADRVSTKLSLSSAQREQLVVVYQKQFTAVQELRGSQANQEMKAKVKATRQESQAEIKRILGDEKFAQYQAMKDEKRAHHKGGHHLQD